MLEHGSAESGKKRGVDAGVEYQGYLLLVYLGPNYLTNQVEVLRKASQLQEERLL